MGGRASQRAPAFVFHGGGIMSPSDDVGAARMARAIRPTGLRLGATLLVVALSILTFSATASAHSAHRSKKAAALLVEPQEGTEEAACTVVASPGSLLDIGEFQHHSSVATIIEVECKGAFAGSKVRIASNELWSKCQRHLSWLVAGPKVEGLSPGENEGKEIQAELDDDGNATVAVIGGPGCAAEGGALVTVDLVAGTHPTTATEVVILPPGFTPEGVYLYPNYGGATGAGAIENATDSSLLGLAVIEANPALAEERLSITDRQLYEKCKIGGKLKWFGFKEGSTGIEEVGAGVEASGIALDNDGNAFVVFEAGESCKSGNSLFEVSLEEAPYTTFPPVNFKVLPPQPTFEAPKPSFTIEKLQEIKGSGTGFSTKVPSAKVGEIVDYEIIVTNTGNVALRFSNFTDEHCTNIVRLPGPIEVEPGHTATWTCEHTLTE